MIGENIGSRSTVEVVISRTAVGRSGRAILGSGAPVGLFVNYATALSS